VLLPSNCTFSDIKPMLVGPGSVVKLDRHFQCLAMEYRGTGASSMPGAPGEATWPAPSMSVFVDDVLSLLDEACWPTCHILAISFGAAVAQELLLRRASGFTAARVLLICPASDVDYGRTGHGCFPLSELLELPMQERSEKMLQLADTRRDAFWLEGEMGQAGLFYMRKVEDALAAAAGGIEGRRYQYMARAGHRSIDRLAEASGGTSAAPAAAEGAAAADDESRQLLSGGAVGTPPPLPPPLYEGVCILAAVHDGIAPPKSVQRLCASLCGCSLVWFDSGHWPNVARECPSRLAPAVLAFLSGTPLPRDVLDASADAETRIGEPAGDVCPDTCALL
jgi:pimeloyl-ACP methyl ester carboxylesterase